MSFVGWASAMVAGPADESARQLQLVVQTNTNSGIFAAGPSIDAAGKLTFTPRPNARGSAAITIVLADDGGTAEGGNNTSAPQTFTIEITKPHVWHNAIEGRDVTLDARIAPNDALEIINFINSFGSQAVPQDAQIGVPFFLDVTGDNRIAPNDALEVINEINVIGSGEGEGEAGERTGGRSRESGVKSQ